MTAPTLIGRQVGPIGFGLMGLTWRQKPVSTDDAIKTMKTALDNGANFWNGGEFYGPPEYNSLVLIEKYFERYPEDADKVVLSIKGGVNPATHAVDGSPDNTRRTINDSIAQMKGRKHLDIFEFARRDQNTDPKVTLDTMNDDFVNKGRISGIALSEVRAETIHEAVKHAKVVAVESEVSLFSTDVLENGVAAACAQHGIPIVAYSPIGRGLLTGQIRKFEDLPEDSMMRQFPRFQPENFPINLQLVHQVEALAKKRGVTPAQFAINWVRALSKRPGMPVFIPIPGATTSERVIENSKTFDLTDAEMTEIDSILAKFKPAGDRYPGGMPVDT
ncbi:Hypothetical predicted protein [Lecanosticta acicola]|uniref:NADP-dependent oxidoreductase domain-containing protein n=1 Tax=Lecanosticta acicola TaxID=111012 RepID=A0AAI9ED69_9PEZI|nr:Hypothetical predicted protein [Lecanosticta acicola]